MGRLRQFAAIIEDQLDLIRRASEGQRHLPAESTELARAIDDGEIGPWYQPIVELATGTTIGYEALARWQHPSGRIRDASGFISLAEDSELVVDMDRAIVKHALSDVCRWREALPSTMINLNLSTRHLELADGIAILHELVTDAGVCAEAVRFELTETHAVSDQQQACAAVRALRGLGYGVILDDFGRGWSTVDRLLSMPVTGIKIDQKVTATLGTRRGDAVIRALANLAAELGIQTIIEGVASGSHAESARRLGCGYGQGYYWSPAVPASTVDAILETIPAPAVTGFGEAVA